ncbi:hypothetical protein [Arthrobacter bussei]|uniref:hypothetical protein n=1 Tax=Arthrobacter bussei TaxID=2594179 RepID=UPI0030CA473C
MITALNELDPYGLDPGTVDGAPHDEYEPEARPMASLLLTRGSISRAQIDAIWQDWFHEPLSDVISPDETQRFCTKLNSLHPPA